MNRVRWMPAPWNIALGVHLYLNRKFGHLSIHLPWGVLVFGFTGRYERSEKAEENEE